VNNLNEAEHSSDRRRCAPSEPFEPALGTHNQRKLVGCLEDATIDRLRSDVVSIRTIAP
jgi:hypothetical protein